MAKSAKQMESIVALCKRRGFIFQSSEIYGGIGGFWDYGPLGVELKRNIKDAWWHDMVTCPPDGPDGKEIKMVGLDASIIMNPKVWEASGHVGGFSDEMVDCRDCKARFRADKVYAVVVADDQTLHMIGDLARFLMQYKGQPTPSGLHPKLLAAVEADSIAEAASLAVESIRGVARTQNLEEWKKCEPAEDQPAGCKDSDLQVIVGKSGQKYIVLVPSDLTAGGLFGPAPCPKCYASGSLTEPRAFNLMFESHAGAVRSDENKVYLRPETAQGIFANFKNVVDSSRVKVPFGIAQIGKAFRNEINPRNYTFRSREFEQMEIEFFCHDDSAMAWWNWWRDVRIHWYVKLGLAGENLIPRDQKEDELAHYSKACTDIEYCFPFADEPQELEGVAHRGCYDLTQHKEHSGKDLSYFDDERKERFLPTVIEPSAGADRSTLAFICEAYTVDESRPSPEVMRFHPRLAPIKAAVFPLVNKDGLPEIAEPIYRALKQRWPVATDAKASIGKRYARMDEAGTPYCFTVDGQTKEDGTVTARDRDTGAQERIDKSRVGEFLQDKMQQRGA